MIFQEECSEVGETVMLKSKGEIVIQVMYLETEPWCSHYLGDFVHI